MYPKYHIVLGAIFALICLAIFPGIGLKGASIIFISSFMIDIDHYIDYAFRKKDFNPIHAVKWHYEKTRKILSMPRHKRNHIQSGLCFLHGLEIVFLLLVFALFFYPVLFFVVAGFIFHLFLDIIYEPTYWDRIDKLSLIYDYFKYKKLRFIEDVD